MTKRKKARSSHTSFIIRYPRFAQAPRVPLVLRCSWGGALGDYTELKSFFLEIFKHFFCLFAEFFWIGDVAKDNEAVVAGWARYAVSL